MHNYTLKLVTGFFFVYFLLILYIRSSCWKDPTSTFFQPERAHVPNYSTIRIQEAEQYADLVAKSPRPSISGRTSPELCVGVSSVEREGISYLKLVLGSLEQGLSAEERAKIYLVVLLAHTDQTRHTDHGQPWLVNMADKLLSYSEDTEEFEFAQRMEFNRSHAIKAKFDYSIVMDECRKTGAPNILMVEDDVVFMDGWYRRVEQALDVATTKTWELGQKDFLYLRLFYYEGLLGWNAESWPMYLFASVAVTAGVFGVLTLTQRHVPTTRPYLQRRVVFLVTLVFTPLLIILCFAAGGNSVLPRPTGVHLMPKNACCGQGLVFPRDKVTDELLPLFRDNKWSDAATDSFIEQHADATGGLRWALTPVVMQHVGGKSSHGVARGGGVTPSYLWNYGFEDYNANALAGEHLRDEEQSQVSVDMI